MKNAILDICSGSHQLNISDPLAQVAANVMEAIRAVRCRATPALYLYISANNSRLISYLRLESSRNTILYMYVKGYNLPICFRIDV